MNSCQQILKEVFERRVLRNPSYSLRSYARDLGLSPASMSLILKGQRGISPLKASEISEKLLFNKSEKNRFVQLATAQFSRSNTQRKAAQATLNSQNNLLKLRKIKVSEVLLQHWYHFAILEAITDSKFVPSVKNLCTRLNLTETQVKNAISDLISINAITELGPDYYKDNLGSLNIEDTPNSYPLRQFHSQIMDLCKIALEEQSSDELYSQSVIFTLDEEYHSEVKSLISKFLLDLSNIVSKPQKKGKIRCVTIQNFNLE